MSIKLSSNLGKLVNWSELYHLWTGQTDRAANSCDTLSMLFTHWKIIILGGQIALSLFYLKSNQLNKYLQDSKFYKILTFVKSSQSVRTDAAFCLSQKNTANQTKSYSWFECYEVWWQQLLFAGSICLCLVTVMAAGKRMHKDANSYQNVFCKIFL